MDSANSEALLPETYESNNDNVGSVGHRTFYNIQYTLYTIQYTLYTIQYTLYESNNDNVGSVGHRTLYSIHALYIAQLPLQHLFHIYAVYIIQYALYIVHYTLYNIHCTLIVCSTGSVAM